MPIQAHERQTKEHTHRTAKYRLKDASFHSVFCNSMQPDLLKSTGAFQNTGPDNSGHSNTAWVLWVTREKSSGVWNMCRPLWTSELIFKWCKQTLSIIECINLLRVKGARDFTSLGLLPYLICQHQTSNNPTVLLPCSHSVVPALLKTVTKPQWSVPSLVHAV